MMRFILALPLFFIVFSCANNDFMDDVVKSSVAAPTFSGSERDLCAGFPNIGTWKSKTTGATISFRKDCSFVTTPCDATGTWPNAVTFTGELQINITATKSPNHPCLAAGNHTCEYELDSKSSPNRLAIRCDKDLFAIYSRM